MNRIALVVALAVVLAGCTSDTLTGPRSLPSRPSMVVAPTGVSVALTSCQGRDAEVTVSWDVDPAATSVTIYAFVANTFSFIQASKGRGSGGNFPNTGSATFLVGLGSWPAVDFYVYQFDGIAHSAPTVIEDVQITRAACQDARRGA